ncbi:type II toxin-antitoxin system Phd/YefM family antitoxin [Klenkia sp. PcliD-1-E]|uniref:type II toxin-antitoxin system Phd/YefM family antitoxin n=1 Tax=Klenkia sp. PcliD-1-E TaxID=2954492 RepID=UPI00209732AD|nr:type II toxin-antitoxin system prevent-host-death family antitoxin [Klenkia sp. PcliD-1-E]MCO7222568.1 type II toxin-antitoxin system prevent-host-death family antitoxin [Klenkia sp. PcliD-1-E]
MTTVVSVYDAKAQLSALLTRVEAGEEIVISRHGKPIARVVPERPEKPRRRPGRLKGQGIVIPDDFDDFTEQDERDWYGE